MPEITVTSAAGGTVAAEPGSVGTRLAALIAAACGPAQPHELRDEPAARALYAAAAGAWTPARRRLARTCVDTPVLDTPDSVHPHRSGRRMRPLPLPPAPSRLPRSSAPASWDGHRWGTGPVTAGTSATAPAAPGLPDRLGA
jgi:hypothetical protein